ncbi:hypothetical protein D3C73_894370 [compost metagenome]
MTVCRTPPTNSRRCVNGHSCMRGSRRPCSLHGKTICKMPSSISPTSYNAPARKRSKRMTARPSCHYCTRPPCVRATVVPLTRRPHTCTPPTMCYASARHPQPMPNTPSASPAWQRSATCSSHACRRLRPASPIARTGRERPLTRHGYAGCRHAYIPCAATTKRPSAQRSTALSYWASHWTAEAIRPRSRPALPMCRP